MGDTNLHLGDIKIKNADTGQEIKINGPLKFNFDNKNLFGFDDCVDSCVYSVENYIKTGDISLTGEPYQQNTTLTDHTVTNAAYNIWNELNNLGNKKENKNMKILELYKERELDYIQGIFEETKKALIEKDAFTKLHNKYADEIKKLYKKEYGEEMKYNLVLGEGFLTSETREAIEKADDEKVFELENLDEMLEEVTAMLDITNDYDKKIEILKKYQILNEEGMINA